MEHTHDNPVVSLEYAQVSKSVIHVTTQERNATIYKLCPAMHQKQSELKTTKIKPPVTLSTILSLYCYVVYLYTHREKNGQFLDTSPDGLVHLLWLQLCLHIRNETP